MISSVEEYAEIIESEDNTTYRLTFDTATEEVWMGILDRFPEYESAMSLNKKLPDSVLERLSRSTDSRVRDIIASKRKTPNAVLLRLARDPNEGIRLGVACNPKASVQVLRLLVCDPWNRVVERAREQLNQIGDNWDPVCSSSLGTPSIFIESPEEFHDIYMSDDPERYCLYRCVSANPEIWRSIYHRYPALRCWVANNRVLTDEIVDMLACDEDSLVRSFLCDNPNTSSAILRLLAGDESEIVRLAVAMNPKTPIDALLSLVDDSWGEIGMSVRLILGRIGLAPEFPESTMPPS